MLGELRQHTVFCSDGERGGVAQPVDCVETVSVSAIADHRHRYKLTGVTQYVCVSGPVRRTT